MNIGSEVQIQLLDGSGSVLGQILAVDFVRGAEAAPVRETEDPVLELKPDDEAVVTLTLRVRKDHRQP